MTLPELSESAAPEFVDAASCTAWLEEVPLANVLAAQAQLAEQLEEFNRFPVSSAHRLEVLEALREAVHFVQIEQAKRFANRALPMAEAESAAFDATIGLWGEMRLGYARCLEAALNKDAAMRAQAGLLCQRALAYSGLKMFHHYRAYREVPPGEWRDLHEAYAHAEALDVADEPVQDFLNRDIQDSSPRIAYARAVLTALASPNELAQRQLTFVAYLLERWASKLEVAKSAIAEGDDVPPLVVDLAGERAPEREASAPAGEPRYLDTRKLAKSLRNRVALLRKGESPAKLALGEDCVQPSCEQLLVFLYRQWCQAKRARSLERRGGGIAAEACTEIPAIHYYISGRVFKQPTEQSSELTQKQRDEIATFGRVSTRQDDEYSHAHGFQVERWFIADESAQGLRLVRRQGEAGKRHAHGELLGVRPGETAKFMLAQVRWLMQAANGDLHAGVRLLPGLPSPVAVRGTGLNVQTQEWLPAIALSAVAALGAPPSLVIPSGWYKPKRVLDLHTGAPAKIRLTEAVERGTDFERVLYEPAS